MGMVKEHEWNPDDPILQSPHAAHELSGVLRWHRAGVPSKEIMSMLKLRGSKLVAAIENGSTAEKQAVEIQRPIHAALFWHAKDE